MNADYISISSSRWSVTLGNAAVTIAGPEFVNLQSEVESSKRSRYAESSRKRTQISSFLQELDSTGEMNIRELLASQHRKRNAVVAILRQSKAFIAERPLKACGIVGCASSARIIWALELKPRFRPTVELRIPAMGHARALGIEQNVVGGHGLEPINFKSYSSWDCCASLRAAEHRHGTY